MAERDYYRILGVARSATREEIRKAYRRLARAYHPDVKPDDKNAEEKFKEISLAYGVLTAADKRAVSDGFGANGAAVGFDPLRTRSYRHGQSASAAGFEFHGGVFDDLFSFNGFENLFANGGRFAGQRAQRGEDIESEMEIDFLDAVRGFQANVSVQRPVSCKNCGGAGRNAEGGTNPCAVCRGNGRVVRTESVHVNIPAGAETAKRIRVPEKGADGWRGGPPGDLYVIPRVRPHPLFSRAGRDLTMDLPISIGEAMRGASVRVPTPMGAVEVKIPAGAQSGQLLRVKGKGVQACKNSQDGDLYLRLLVRVPKGVTEIEIIEKLEMAYDENIRQDIAL